VKRNEGIMMAITQPLVVVVVVVVGTLHLV
jgi:hypothetical protein